MRCRQGILAITTGLIHSGNNGKIVKVGKRHLSGLLIRTDRGVLNIVPTEEPSWEIEVLSDVPWKFAFENKAYVAYTDQVLAIHDKYLIPIENPGEDEVAEISRVKEKEDT